MADSSDTDTLDMGGIGVEVVSGYQNAQHSCVDLHKADRRRYLKIFIPIIIVLSAIVFILAIFTGYFSGRYASTNAFLKINLKPTSSLPKSRTTPIPDFSSRDVNLDGEWLKYKSHFAKVYPNDKEDKKRRMIWEDNLRFIQQHNIEYARGMHTHLLGLNKFSDRTRAEFENRYARGGCVGSNMPAGAKSYVSKNTFKLRSGFYEYSWRASGRVHPPKNQISCGSCWAFSAVAAVESHYAIKHKTSPIEFSEQQLVDCSRRYGNYGCDGGMPSRAFKYLMNNPVGIVQETCYKYTNKNGTCRLNSLPPVCRDKTKTIQVTGFIKLTDRNETQMMQALYEYGPLSVVIDVASDHFQNYPNGGLVLNPPDCSESEFNHAVLIVGYGTHYNAITGQSVPYWLIKNSWGRSWGEMGYFKLFRGGNTCGVANRVTFPLIK